eukprot:scaffold6247_cov416-Prasinococcus_capsulatus_cf.AAC.18
MVWVFVLTYRLASAPPLAVLSGLGRGGCYAGPHIARTRPATRLCGPAAGGRPRVARGSWWACGEVAPALQGAVWVESLWISRYPMPSSLGARELMITRRLVLNRPDVGGAISSLICARA